MAVCRAEWRGHDRETAVHGNRAVSLMLTLLTLFYLTLPYFIFAWGWLSWPLAGLLSGVLIVALGSNCKRYLNQPPSIDAANVAASRRDRWLLYLLTVIIILPCGIGGVGFQKFDWWKHNAVLHDLTVNSWPVVAQYAEDGSPKSYLTYYIAYYLPAAAVGHVFGLTAAHLALFVWTLLGLLLCAQWVTKLVSGWAPLVWFAWFALSGMDFVLGLLSSGVPNEWWSEYWQYPANMSLLVWVPQHMLPGWLATAVIVDELEQGRDLSRMGFILALTALWSPFVTIGLAPLAIVLLIKGRWRTIWSYDNLVAGPAVLGVTALFLASVQNEQIRQGIIFSVEPWQKAALLWPLFCLGEFGVYAILIAPFLSRQQSLVHPPSRLNFVWFLVAVVTLSLLPFYVIGIYNDLCMRASIPCLFLFWVVLLRTIVESSIPLTSWRGRLLIGCLLMAALYPAGIWARGAVSMRPRFHYYHGSRDASVLDFPQKYWPQYLGLPDRFFYRHMSKAAPLQVPVTNVEPDHKL